MVNEPHPAITRYLFASSSRASSSPAQKRSTPARNCPLKSTNYELLPQEFTSLSLQKTYLGFPESVKSPFDSTTCGLLRFVPTPPETYKASRFNQIRTLEQKRGGWGYLRGVPHRCRSIRDSLRSGSSFQRLLAPFCALVLFLFNNFWSLSEKTSSAHQMNFAPGRGVDTNGPRFNN